MSPSTDALRRAAQHGRGVVEHPCTTSGTPSAERDPRLDAWQRLLQNESHPEEPAPDPAARDALGAGGWMRDGFIEGSEAWADALACGETPIALPRPDPQRDLFTEPAPARYTLDADALALPRGYGAPAPEDAAGAERDADYHTALGWDAARVLFACPRGLCTLARAAWEEGERACRGC